MNYIEPEIIVVSPKEIRRLLEKGQGEYLLQLNDKLVEKIVQQFQLWPNAAAPDPQPGRTKQGRIAQHIVRFLLYDVEQCQKDMRQLKHRYSEYSQRYNKAVSEDEKKTHIIQYAKDMGASTKHIRGDKKAFRRWFGHDAMSDRYRRRFLELERYLSFVLQCLGRMAALTIQSDGDIIGHDKMWPRLSIEPVIKPLLSYDGDQRVVSAAFHCLTQALTAMPLDQQHQCLSQSSLQFIYHACLSSTQSVWVQCEALKLLQSASPANVSTVLERRLQHPQADDDLFVRRTVIEILGQELPIDHNMDALIPLAIQDPSPSVRQKIPEALNGAEIRVIKEFYPALLLDDEVEQVRASSLLNLNSLRLREDCADLALYYLVKTLKTETQRFPLRVALKVCREFVEEHKQKTACIETLLPVIECLHQQADELMVRRWAAETREYLHSIKDEKSAQQLKSLQQFVTKIPPGKTRRIPKDLQCEDNAQLARLLSVIAQHDFGFDIENGLFGSFITRGHAFGFRIWRLLHEFRHPSPDKRQAFQHTRGRLFWGTTRVPSAILSELAETKVPGEPLYIDTEDGWRGYLPLVDEVVSGLATGNKPTWFYHSEGITRLQPPTNFIKRWFASWHISYYFTNFTQLRNWKESSQDSPQSYLNALSELGIEVTFKGHQCDYVNSTSDTAVMRFFPLTLPLIDLQHWQEFKDYFVSVYENTLYELSLFLGISISYFLGRHLYLYHKMKQARNSIPLVLGGWGTRGKSGTERIKAAMMNALGYSIVSKTTGCEAMFLHAHPFGELKEMFLFRPYDKATIWEQHNLVCLSDELDCEVYLWECMGLTPSYIDILQRQWMRDDIATITNTYPDHEDLQGPAGVNIPEVMTQFIPEKSTVLTSEEQMLPILQAAAYERKANFRSISWLESGLLADDVLERFPYDEHPFNIALVMAMGDEIGVPGDFALKEMADRVVADIGVLKTFPCSPWRSRRLEFINGMSANERFGCLGNWQRMGLDKVSMLENPDTWVTLVVNNRADRIARSRVFASIVVKDISYDRCVIIGNNLSGMVSYIKEAWAEWIETISLKSNDETAEAILLRMAERFKVPHSQEILHKQFQAMLDAQECDTDKSELFSLIDQTDQLEQKMQKSKLTHHQEVLEFLQQAKSLNQSYQDFLAKLQQAGGSVSDSLQQEFNQLLWQWFEQKLEIVEDYHSTGNQVIERVCNVTPPGFYNRILGMQNIKGTGLDFVYRWQAWENCHKACMQLESTNKSESAKGLATLASFAEYGHLAKETVLSTIEKVKQYPLAQNERYQAEMDLIQANLQDSLAKLSSNNDAQESNSSSWVTSLSHSIEAFLDAGDAVKRRKKADQIYQDLVDERISHDRAVLELQSLNKRQKGGWFSILK